ncbi:MAG: hypothetical protein JWN54_2275 [Mycobacterium sp.]|nr:hypothetical protein [Mycobacterium sp.]
MAVRREIGIGRLDHVEGKARIGAARNRRTSFHVEHELRLRVAEAHVQHDRSADGAPHAGRISPRRGTGNPGRSPPVRLRVLSGPDRIRTRPWEALRRRRTTGGRNRCRGAGRAVWRTVPLSCIRRPSAAAPPHSGEYLISIPWPRANSSNTPLFAAERLLSGTSRMSFPRRGRPSSSRRYLFETLLGRVVPSGLQSRDGDDVTDLHGDRHRAPPGAVGDEAVRSRPLAAALPAPSPVPRPARHPNRSPRPAGLSSASFRQGP